MNQDIEQQLPKPPKDYRIFWDGSNFLLQFDSYWHVATFELTNRGFIKLHVNEPAPYIVLCRKPLIDYLTQNPEATVMDLAGGYKSNAAAEIAAWFPGTRVFNIDIMAARPPGVRADARQLPVQDSSIDLVLSIQFLRYIKEKDLSLIVSEVERVPKPGGYFFADQRGKCIKPQMLTRVDALSTEKITVYGKPG